VLVLVAHSALGLERYLVPVAAGGFLYIACADLVPEMRLRLRGFALVGALIALLGGIALMAGVHEIVHAGHDHGHGGHGDHSHDHDGHGHEHD
jgi:hypothetical protein